MATYRTVVNVPSIPGSNELLPQPWATQVIDYGIAQGFINITDRHKEDWLEIVGSGRYWTFEYRQDMPRRVANLEADIVALAASATSQLAVNAAHLEAHDAMLDVMRLQDTRIDGLQSRLAVSEEHIANILLLLSGDQPPTTGNWWDTQRDAALATLVNDWGAQAGATNVSRRYTTCVNIPQMFTKSSVKPIPKTVRSARLWVTYTSASRSSPTLRSRPGLDTMRARKAPESRMNPAPIRDNMSLSRGLCQITRIKGVPPCTNLATPWEYFRFYARVSAPRAHVRQPEPPATKSRP